MLRANVKTQIKITVLFCWCENVDLNLDLEGMKLELKKFEKEKFTPAFGKQRLINKLTLMTLRS